ncbi:hypothetical protein MUK42_02370 [Musa troglodytarum]|uniref:Uncharacterized protein n=2 Tax=Musa troglodytarum TaxID=320322 RepID=A0A9E7I4T8_9LILI|nr:hypothetical protein MUK42_02370 [Musa troglodytarum]
MSRCFPYPPPGFEKKTSDHVDILAEEKHRKKHKKEKRDKEKREGKEKKDKDRIKDKHKEKKDRKGKHKDKKKDEGTDKSRILYDRSDKKIISLREDTFGECSRKSEEINHSRFTEELDRRTKDEEKVATSTKIDNFSSPIAKSIGSLGAAALVKERPASDKIIPPSMGASQRRNDGLERPAGKYIVSTQRRNEGPVSAGAVPKERITNDKLVPELASTGQRGNGGRALPVEKPVGSVQRRFEDPSPANCLENDNYKSNKVASCSSSVVQSTINGMGRQAQIFSTNKNVDSIGLATKMDDRREPNKIIQMEQRRIDGMDGSVEKGADNRTEEGKAKNKEREADDRKEERHRDGDHDQKKKKKIKDKDTHKGNKKEKAKIKERGEQKHKKQNEPQDGRKKDQLDGHNLEPLAPQTDDAKNYLINDNVKKRKEIHTNGFRNENNLLPNKFPRAHTSSHLCEENGWAPDSSHVATACPSVKPEAINTTLIGKPVAIKEQIKNGITKVQPSSVGFVQMVAAETGATSKICTSPHPDSMCLNQPYCIPKVDEWPEHDDQEWLFSSCQHLQQPKPKLETNEVPNVWSEALRIKSEDLVALPYVIPF